MNTLRFSGLLLALAFSAGCSDHELPDEVGRKLQDRIRRVGLRSAEADWNQFYAELNSVVSDEGTRNVCYSNVFARLLSVDLGGAERTRRAFAYKEIADNLWRCLPLAPVEGISMESVFDLKLARLNWMRNQLQNVRGTDMDAASGVRDGLLVRNGGTCDTFCSCALVYVEQLALFEGRVDAQLDFYRVGEDERKRIKAKIERFLGRPIRTRAQIHQDRIDYQSKGALISPDLEIPLSQFQ